MCRILTVGGLGSEGSGRGGTLRRGKAAGIEYRKVNAHSLQPFGVAVVDMADLTEEEKEITAPIFLQAVETQFSDLHNEIIERPDQLKNANLQTITTASGIALGLSAHNISLDAWMEKNPQVPASGLTSRSRAKPSHPESNFLTLCHLPRSATTFTFKSSRWS